MTVTREKPASATSPAESVALVATLSSAYVVSQLLRNSVGVIAPDLAAEMAISASQLGVLSSVFFFSFAAAQLPLGIAIDRYGPKRCMLVCAVVVIFGAILFALARTPLALIAARTVMGLGTSCYLMAPLALYAKRFPPERFAMFVGMQLGFGSIGTLLATAPLAFAAAAIGWRASFLVVAAAMIVIGILTAIVVREPPWAALQAPRETLRESIFGIREAIRLSSVGRLFFMHMAGYSSFVVLVGLWGGPYLTHVYGFDLTGRGSLLLIPAVSQVIGLIIFGPADRLFGSYKVPATIGALLTAAFLSLLAIVGTLPMPLLIVWLALFGICAGFTPLVIAHGKSLFPPRLLGRGITVLNVGTMGGVFVAQTVSGFVIDLFPSSGGAYPVVAYRLVFALQAVFLVSAALAYVSTRDPLKKTSRKP